MGYRVMENYDYDKRNVTGLDAHGKYAVLVDYLKELGSCAIAFSGGVDSTFLVAAAHEALGDNMIAVTAKSETFSERERNEAAALCRKLGVRHVITETTELDIPGFSENPPDRCYICKKGIFGELIDIAGKNGMACVCEGSNMDDMGDYRPGLRAIRELGVKSPLRTAGLTKQEIRNLSKEMNLPTWDKPSFACLASRFVYGETITKEKLVMVGTAEEVLRSIGIKQFRVRMHGKTVARIEVLPEDFAVVLEHRSEILGKYRELGFTYVAMDLAGYRTGSMNETL